MVWPKCRRPKKIPRFSAGGLSIFDRYSAGTVSGCVVFAEFVRIDVTVILVVVIFLQDGLQLEAAGFVKFAGRQVLLGPFGFDEKLFAAEFAHGFKQPGDHFAADAVPAVAA